MLQRQTTIMAGKPMDLLNGLLGFGQILEQPERRTNMTSVVEILLHGMRVTRVYLDVEASNGR